jgi:pimeloyl-ACP methyl ester carboxylesterase
VLMVHGWTLDLAMWEPQVEALRSHFRVVRLDRRGHGLSGGRADAARDAGDLRALCRHLGLEQVGLIGMSQGARGVLGFASAAPTEVSAMILDGPPSVETPDSEDVPLGELQELLRTQGIAAFRRAWARTPFMQLRTADARAHELVEAMLGRYAGHDLLGNTAAAGVPALPLAPLRTPTLVLVGAHDAPSRLNAAAQLAARLPAARLVVIADAGHLPNLDKPARYSELCREFLARHAPAGA